VTGAGSRPKRRFNFWSMWIAFSPQQHISAGPADPEAFF
jgi:hypothetical protein